MFFFFNIQINIFLYFYKKKKYLLEKINFNDYLIFIKEM